MHICILCFVFLKLFKSLQKDFLQVLGPLYIFETLSRFGHLRFEVLEGFNLFEVSLNFNKIVTAHALLMLVVMSFMLYLFFRLKHRRGVGQGVGILTAKITRLGIIFEVVIFFTGRRGLPESLKSQVIIGSFQFSSSFQTSGSAFIDKRKIFFDVLLD